MPPKISAATARDAVKLHRKGARIPKDSDRKTGSKNSTQNRRVDALRRFLYDDFQGG